MRSRILLALASLAAAVAMVLPASAVAEICPAAPSMSVGGTVSASCYWPNVSVSVSPASIQLGGSATVTWSVSGGDPAISCQKGGAWSGSIGLDAGGGASGSSVVTPSTFGDLTYSITCQANPEAGYAEAVLHVGPGDPVNQTYCTFRELAVLSGTNVYAYFNGSCTSTSLLLIQMTQCVQKTFNLGLAWKNVECDAHTIWGSTAQMITSYACRFTTYPYNKYRGQTVVKVTEVFTGRTSGAVATSHGLNASSCD